VVHDLGLVATTGTTGEQFLRANKVGDLFANELVQASTRVNYAQNLETIHGVETMVCLATDGAMSIEGGNWQIFDHMINSSSAGLRLNTTVTDIERLSDGRHLLYAVSSKSSSDSSSSSTVITQKEPFDSIILAAPYQFSDINFRPPPRKELETIPYVQLHVTLFTTPHRLRPAYFNLKPGNPVPLTILTTLPPSDGNGRADDTSNDKRQHYQHNRYNPAGPAGFFSISAIDRVTVPNSDPYPDGTPLQHTVYKIFSPDPITASFLYDIIDISPVPEENSFDGTDATLNPDHVSWLYRKVWYSYPQELPRVTFGEMVIDEGLWYTSPIEAFISTMETSALAGKNVARLVVNEWEGKGYEGYGGRFEQEVGGQEVIKEDL
jgi:prenylcysteine oxidase/farnesylcysteine lyase